MSCYSKEKSDRHDYNNVCKSHSARSDRELYRICPSKLSKRELEDLYFSLLENNLEMKRTINGQQDKIKGLATKVQRMTAAQKMAQGKEVKECCVGTKTVVTEQKESITELKRTNEKMAERIRHLNMKLCSAKQFFKKSPQVSTSRCLRCAANAAATASASSGPKKHNCLDKPEQVQMPVLKCAASCQYVDRDVISMKSVQTEPREQQREKERHNEDQTCDENKCRTLMEDLKSKIVNLQEELSTVHTEYSNRISRLESEVSDVRKENIRVNSERHASEHELHNTTKRNSELLASYRSTEAKCAELSTQLAIEKRKVAELETRLKAANISDRLNKTIEDHLTNINDPNIPRCHMPSQPPTSQQPYGQYRTSNVPYQDPYNPQRPLKDPTQVSCGHIQAPNDPDCVCAHPPPGPIQKSVKPQKPVTCACPKEEGDTGDVKTVPTKKSFFSKVGNKSSSNKTASQKTSSCKTESKCPNCCCSTDQQSEPVHSTPKSSKSVVCGCPPPERQQPPKEPPVSCGCPSWEATALLIKPASLKEVTKCKNCCCVQQQPPCSPSKTGKLPPAPVSDYKWSPTYQDDSKVSKPSDDSGYTDTNHSHDADEGIHKLNKELVKRIIELQSQVDSMKIAGARRLDDIGGEMVPGPILKTPPVLGVTKEIEPQPTITANRELDYSPTVSLVADEQSPHKSDIVSKPIALAEESESIKGIYATLKTEPDDTRAQTIRDKTGRLRLKSADENKPMDIRFQSYDYGNENLDANKIVTGPKEQMPAECLPCHLENDNLTTARRDFTEPSKTELFPGKSKTTRPEGVPVKKIRPQYESHDQSNVGEQKLSDAGGIPKDSPVNKSKTEERMHRKGSFSADKIKILETGSIPSNPELGFGIRTKLREDRAGTSIKQSSDAMLAARERCPSKSEIIFGKPTEGPQADDLEVLPGKLKLPVPDTAASEATRLKPQDTPAEHCERCAACSYEKECAVRARNTRHSLDPTNTKYSPIGAKLAQTMKNDRHNSLQIPGPIPASDNNNNKDWKKNVMRHFSLDKKKEIPKGKEKSKDRKGSNKESLNKPFSKKHKQKPDNFLDLPLVPDVPLITNKEEEPDELADVSRRNYFSLHRDSFEVQKQSSNGCISVIKDSDGMPIVNVVRGYRPSNHMLPTLEVDGEQREQGTQLVEKTDVEQMADQPQEQSVQAPDNNAALPTRRREVSVYRRTSGTLCFRTLPTDAEAPPRSCRCSLQLDGYCGSRQNDKGIQIVPMSQAATQEAQPGQGPLSAMSEQGTYTVGSKQTQATSPDNTDNELSYMSDLPMEKEGSPDKTVTKSSSPGGQSPGEDKMTTTYMDSYSSAAATHYSLSEGELPATTPRKPPDVRDKETKTATSEPPASTSSQNMEATLQAISEELARCRTLLTRRPNESPQPVRMESNQSQQTTAPDPGLPIALRRGVATQSIGDTYSPKCIFTLHIGTVVLSDEAVLNSRNKTMVLTWKFYDQNIAMTRMRAGRVVLFDFSTEYDIKLTEEFLHYMKHEEMPIIICEMDKENEPFASCTLPLRDALLHTNRRADMSLALVAGPQMLKARVATGAAADDLDARDEMGVIDIWCMLRADADLLPGINRAIAQTVTPVPNRHTTPWRTSSRVMQQILDDDHSNDLDLTLQHSPRNKRLKNNADAYRDVDFARMPTSTWGEACMQRVPGVLEHYNNTQTGTGTKEEIAYDPNNYPPVRRRNSAINTLPADAYKPDLLHEDPEHDSGIIVTEVEAKIKSPEDLKQVLEKHSNERDTTRMPKSEEDVISQAHSSMGSLRSVLASLNRRGSPRPYVRRDSIPRTLIQGVSRISKTTLDPVNPIKAKDKEETSDMEIYRKYENISKLMSSSRTDPAKKSVTILPSYVDAEDEPQRDMSDNQVEDDTHPSLDITVLWLALNEECEAMVSPHVQRVYVAYSFLGRTGAELETPVSLPKPKHYVDKCYFNFKKTFELEDTDLPKLGHMARCRAGSKVVESETDCIIFSVVSEPPEDPLGLENCEDIGYAYLYLGDLLAYSAGSTGYTEVIPVRAARGGESVCGVLAVRLDGLDVVRRCLLLPAGMHHYSGI